MVSINEIMFLFSLLSLPFLHETQRGTYGSPLLPILSSHNPEGQQLAQSFNADWVFKLQSLHS